MAVLERRDLDLYGWADGVLVSFEIRAGRLCRWQQRRCGERTARRRLAATPGRYRDFANRNAALALRMINS